MSSFDSIVIGQDLISDHYLTAEFDARVRAVRKQWAELESYDKHTPRTGLRTLGAQIATDLARLRDAGPRDGARKEALLDLYSRVRAALGIDAPRTTLAFERGPVDLTLDAVVHRTASGLHLVVLQADDATTVEDVLDGDAAGALLDPLTRDGAPELRSTTAQAISELLLATHPAPPPLVAVQAGGWLLVTERTRWAEGRWLAVDLATAGERRDQRAAGELETIAALIGDQALLPAADGSCGFLDMLTDAVTHAVGVSKDLREGVRASIEYLATEVLHRRRASGLTDDAVPDLPRQLTRQSLRYLYRILFLLYAEAHPELGVLPVGDPDYRDGYGLDRLRDLCLVDLTSQKARGGRHLYASLGRLFTLVEGGHAPSDSGADSIVIEALRSDLFRPSATALIDEVGLGNAALQRVLSRLLLTARQTKRERGFVSYAQLGINQLGAVYEGLMSYTGRIAETDLYEVAKDGVPEKGSWLVPAAGFDGSGIDPTHRVLRLDPDTGETKAVVYRRGEYMLRLSGRDRQRSASYYTPQVLTACVVRHSLAELLDQPDPDDPDGEPRITPAADLLRWRICEPALGSGAFLVEAIDQIATEYLKRAQAERDEAIDPADMPAQRQKVKAYLALHNCFGVDLNDTAVELAEISLWLASVHPGLQAPWFGLRLRRGNSLIGARRAVYRAADYGKVAWWKQVPTERPLGEDLMDGEVHHFLLPSHGWGAAVDTAEAKEFAPHRVDHLKSWRTAIRKAPPRNRDATQDGPKRLAALAQRVETLWELAALRLEIAHEQSRRAIDVWGAPEKLTSGPPGGQVVSREQIEESLADAGGAYQRLRLVMDAWCALWFWPVLPGIEDHRHPGDPNDETTAPIDPPDWAAWLDGVEALLGRGGIEPPKAERRGRRDTGVRPETPLFSQELTWDSLNEQEKLDRQLSGASSVDVVLDKHPWLVECRQIAEREGFFHWQLDFAPVFASGQPGGGGFDLQVGNPPWVRPDWEDDTTLAEDDPWFTLAFKPSTNAVRRRRAHVLQDDLRVSRYLTERASMAGTAAHLRSAVDRPVLTALQPDLYRCFMERTWRSMSATGVIGLIHPETHFTEARAGNLREETYRRLRRHWQFRNELSLFEINNTREFGVSVYGPPGQVAFLSASSIYWPSTIDDSLTHQGIGAEPGVKDDEDRWDVRPHRARLLRVDERVLADWAALIDEPGTPPRRARLLRPVNLSSQAVLAKLAKAPRFASIEFSWTRGWEEDRHRREGYFRSDSAVPGEWADVILQGPHFWVATPLSKQPRPTMKSNRDHEPWDLETLDEEAIPRTSFQPAKPRPQYRAGYPHWEGQNAADFFRLVWRRRLDVEMARTTIAALLFPGPCHVHSVLSASASSRNLAVAAGMWASIPVDFLVKVIGKADLVSDVVLRLPHPTTHTLVDQVIFRALRLNCLIRAYAPLWEELWDPAWQGDAWTVRSPSEDWPYQPALLGDAGSKWSVATPLRRDFDRRQALVELDALAAIMLGISADELCSIYRTQFGALRKSEKASRYDANGRKVPADVLKEHAKHGPKANLGHYVLPFVALDREADMTRAHQEFFRRLEVPVSGEPSRPWPA